MVTTPTGKPVAMVHCNNCTSDLNAWVNIFDEFAASIGAKKMAELAKAQEMAGKEGRIDEIDANGSKLLADYAELLKVIEMLLEKNG